MSAQWQHEFLDTELPLNASFEQGSDSHFTVYGPKVGRDSALLTAAINVGWVVTPATSRTRLISA